MQVMSQSELEKQYLEGGCGIKQAWLLASSYTQSLFSSSAETSFLFTDPSLLALQNYAAETIGYRQRHHGGIFELTHYMESAVWAYNCMAKAMDELPAIERAYTLFGHDLVEMLVRHGITVKDVVIATWRGDKTRIPYLIAAFEQFEDDPRYSKPERLISQVEKSKDWRDGLVPYGHVGEKLCTYSRDLYNINNDLLIFVSANDARIYFHEVLMPRVWAIGRFKTDPELREEFAQLVKDIKNAIRSQLTRVALDRTDANPNVYKIPKRWSQESVPTDVKVRKLGRRFSLTKDLAA